MVRRYAFSTTTALAMACVCGCLLAVWTTPASAQQAAFREWTDQDKEALLLNGELVARQDIGIGITESERVTLEREGIRHDAQIQTVNERVGVKRFDDGSTELNFTDCYCYNIAAYRLDRLIGLEMVPVAVHRRDSQRGYGAFTWWVDDVQMMELERYQEGINPPHPFEWYLQLFDGNVFQQLIYNTDPNLGNTLITDDWEVRLIDFTRAFRRHKDLPRAENLPRMVSRGLYDGLRSLTMEALETSFSDLIEDYLISEDQLEALLARRDLILMHFDRLIAERGESIVLMD